MDLKKRSKLALSHTRGFTEQVLSEFQQPQDWIRRASPNSNHAIWIAGHILYAENFFTGLVDPSQKQDFSKYASLFGKGSSLADNLDNYPSPEEILQLLKDQRKIFREVLNNCTEEDFQRKIEDGPAFMFDVAAVFQMSVWHESLHCGQLTVIHRSLGNSPLADRAN